MKKLLICLLLSTSVFAGVETEYKPSVIEAPFKVTTYCQDGYKFLIVQTLVGDFGERSPAVSVIQMFEPQERTYVPQPVKCTRG